MKEKPVNRLVKSGEGMKYLIMTMIASMFCAVNYKVGYALGYEAGQLDSLPTQSEIQEILGVGVDGVIGPESREAWDAATLESPLEKVEREYVLPYMERFMRAYDVKHFPGIEFNYN